MKRFLFLTAAAALSACFAWGALGDIVASFPAPATYPIALAVPANYVEYLWVYCNENPFRIYRVSGNTGSIYSSYVSPFGLSTHGLTYSWKGGGGLPQGSYLWIGNRSNNYIYRCNYVNGSIYASFPANHDVGGGLAAMATGDGGSAPTYMLSNAQNPWNPRPIYRQNLLTGLIYDSFVPPYRAYDLAWDWRNEIIWTGNIGNIVYGYNTAGSLVSYFRIPKRYPLGFAYTSNYLWVSTTAGSHWIWKIHCPKFVDNKTNIKPASIGKIKATFR